MSPSLKAIGIKVFKDRAHGKREPKEKRREKVKKNEKGIAAEKAARIIITRQEGGLNKVGRQKTR